MPKWPDAQHVDLTGADLSLAAARQGLWLDVQAAQTTANDADFGGLLWKNGTLIGANWSTANVAGGEWVDVASSGPLAPVRGGEGQGEGGGTKWEVGRRKCKGKAVFPSDFRLRTSSFTRPPSP